jgi:hypothetical protein
LVEGTFGRMLSMLGGKVVDRESSEPDPETERELAEQLGKVWLAGLDLGLPPGVDPVVLSALEALESGHFEGANDEALARAALAAIDEADSAGYIPGATRLATLLDAFDPDLLRPLLCEDFGEHAPAVRLRWAGLLAQLDKAEALELGIELMLSEPRGLALDDAAAALQPWCNDDALLESMEAVVLEEVPPQPGTRLEGAATDLLLHTVRGARAVARRAARDREAEPHTWWAARKLAERPSPQVLPTLLLFGAPQATVPSWLAALIGSLDDDRARRIGDGGRLSEQEASDLQAEERTFLEAAD